MKYKRSEIDGCRKHSRILARLARKYISGNLYALLKDAIRNGPSLSWMGDRAVTLFLELHGCVCVWMCISAGVLQWSHASV